MEILKKKKKIKQSQKWVSNIHSCDNGPSGESIVFVHVSVIKTCVVGCFPSRSIRLKFKGDVPFNIINRLLTKTVSFSNKFISCSSKEKDHCQVGLVKWWKPYSFSHEIFTFSRVGLHRIGTALFWGITFVFLFFTVI